MGKRIIAQRRGRGSPTYRVPKRGRKFRVDYRESVGKITDIINDPGRNPPLAKVLYEDGTTSYIISPRGSKIGDSTEFISPLEKIPVGSYMFGIETYPNSGPKLCRTSGSFAILVSKSKKKCVIKLSSKKKKTLDSKCRASIGIPAGEGFKEKPWVKAGKKWIAMHRKGKLYPRTSGVAMTAGDHPLGGPTKPGKHITVSRHAPPGRKVGSWGAKRTGRKKGKK